MLKVIEENIQIHLQIGFLNAVIEYIQIFVIKKEDTIEMG